MSQYVRQTLRIIDATAIVMASSDAYAIATIDPKISCARFTLSEVLPCIPLPSRAMWPPYGFDPERDAAMKAALEEKLAMEREIAEAAKRAEKEEARRIAEEEEAAKKAAMEAQLAAALEASRVARAKQAKPWAQKPAKKATPEGGSTSAAASPDKPPAPPSTAAPPKTPPPSPAKVEKPPPAAASAKADSSTDVAPAAGTASGGLQLPEAITTLFSGVTQAVAEWHGDHAAQQKRDEHMQAEYLANSLTRLLDKEEAAAAVRAHARGRALAAADVAPLAEPLAACAPPRSSPPFWRIPSG